MVVTGAQDAALALVEPAQVGLGAGRPALRRPVRRPGRVGCRGGWPGDAPAGCWVRAVRWRVITSRAWSGPSSDREQHLEEELVPRRRARRRGPCVHQAPSSSRPDGGDGVALLPVGLVAHHQAVALQPVEGRVHLPDVERPGLARRRLEGGLQLVPVARPLVQQGQQALSHRHGYRVCILGMPPSRSVSAQHRPPVVGGHRSRDSGPSLDGCPGAADLSSCWPCWPSCCRLLRHRGRADRGADDDHHRGRRPQLLDHHHRRPGAFTPEPIGGTTAAGCECATLDVPLDYDDPDGEQIEIFVGAHPGHGRAHRRAVREPRRTGGGAERSSPRRWPRPPRGDHRALRHRRRRPPRRGRQHPDRLRGRRRRAVRRRRHASTPRRTKRRSSRSASSYVDDCAESLRRPAPLRRHARRGRGHGRGAGRHGRRPAQLPRASATAPPSARCTPTCSPTGSARWCSTACSSSVPPASSRPTSRPPASRPPSTASCEYCDAGEGCASAGDALDAVEEVLALAEAAGRHPGARRRSAGRARRGRPRHQLRPLLPAPLGARSDSALAAALDGDGSELVDLADGYLGIGDFEVYFAVNCIDFAWPSGDPDAFLRAAKDDRRRPHRTSARRS